MPQLFQLLQCMIKFTVARRKHGGFMSLREFFLIRGKGRCDKTGEQQHDGCCCLRHSGPEKPTGGHVATLPGLISGRFCAEKTHAF